jgi:hypothetical protein
VEIGGPCQTFPVPTSGAAEQQWLVQVRHQPPAQDLCEKTGRRHDPCLLDTFIAAVRFMAEGPKKPWWAYSAERKRRLAARTLPADSD